MSALASSLTFQQLISDGVLSPIHQAFGEAIQRLDASVQPDVVLAAALCSEQLSRGHVCLDLPAAHRIEFPTSEADLRIRQYSNWPEISRWVSHLQSSPLVTVVETGDRLESATTPLVFGKANQRLYLARYWYFEQRLAGNIARRLQQPAMAFNESRLQKDIQALFPDRESAGSRDQCLAVANSVDRWFSVITGGPGTGKTTTVTRLLAARLLQSATLTDQATDLRILLMAPTGKAAQRLNESLSRATRSLDVDASVRQQLEQVTAGTIHRLLGWTPLPPERGGPFRHRAALPLEADIVLVDEASMVDLALMCRLFDAIPLTTQIILIGDRDQLASVEAGGVLSDLCGNLAGETFDRLNDDRQQIIAQRTGLRPHQNSSKGSDSESTTSKAKKQKVTRRRNKADTRQMSLPLGDDWTDDAQPGKSTEPLALSECVASLNFSHRFSRDSALGQLAAAIREGRADDAISLLRSADPSEIHWLDAEGDHSSSIEATIDRAASGYRDYLERLRECPAGSVDVLNASARLRVLCAHRSGLRGEAMMNQRIADRLIAKNLLSPYGNESLGRLVMVTRNDYRLDLFNGDVGVIAKSDDRSSTSSDRARTIIMEDAREETGLRRVPVALVPGVQDCFAMTIHRSQGSEFHQVLLVLPEHDSPVLSRELLYTAVTRVKELRDPESGTAQPGFLSITGNEAVLRAAIKKCIHRVSGLADGIASRTAHAE